MVNLEVPHFSTAAPLGATRCTFQPPFTIRRVGLCGSELARAQVTTIRLKVLKIGTVILRNTRRIRLLFSSAYPDQELFGSMLRKLNSA